MKMKKYLMTGIAALALCAGFTSCSHDVEGFTSLKEAKTAEYNAAFVQNFGKPAANQDWGFKRNTRTRAIDVNGNQWNGEDIPLVDVEGGEAQAIYDYVNMTLDEMRTAEHKFSTKAPDELTNYFVTQVWKGISTDTNLDNQTTTGSNHMDHLVIAMEEDATIDYLGRLSEGWQHIYNFNAGNNTNWNGNTRVVDGGCFDFAYHGSEDSKYHNRWIIVDGKDITPDQRYAGYYYVCFDFMQISSQAYTVFTNPDENNQSYDVPGIWSSTAEAVEAGAKVRGNYIGMDENYNSIYAEGDKLVGENWVLQRVVNGNQCYYGDNTYTDWIIRIVNAEPDENEDPVVDSGRIFCEDLGGIGDFDFNDVVFDAYIYESGKIDIEVFAAGGTLPISVAGVPITIGKMKNTGEGNAPHQIINVTAEQATANGWNSLISIPIVVSQTNAANEVESYELQANIGQVPQKICVPLGTPWVDEYINIEKAYPSFKDYVAGRVSAEACWSNYVEKYVDLNLSNNNE